jgi:hypothetical protein
MLNKFLIVILCCITGSITAQAQNPLPDFTIRDLGQNRVAISWVNPFESCIQLNVQRSFDSSNNFRTIFSTPSPELPQNGYVDAKAPYNKMYYRIFYVLQGGAYFFTAAKRIGQGFENIALIDSSSANRIVTIRKSDSIITQIPFYKYKQFRDSIIYQTKDSLFAVNEEEIVIKPFVPLPPAWRPSVYLFTNREGFVTMHLPDAQQKHYKVVIYDTDGKELYNIAHVKEVQLILDKADFIHAGWFSFDLFEDGKLKEKNRFYIPKEF